MATLLLTVIYISFIGLGLPDSLFGTAWPAIYSEFDIPISYGSFVTVTVSCGTVIASIISSRLINRFGTSLVSAFSTLLTAAALIGFSFSQSILSMCLLSIPLGMGAGAIDTALNNYVALHYSATHMSFLHCFYGLGVTVSPYILSLVIEGKYGWRGGFRIVFLIQLLITVILFTTLPLWKKAHGGENAEKGTVAKQKSFIDTLKTPGVKLMCMLFITSCAIECTCGGWGSTFLVEYKKTSPETAARVIMLYYAGIAIGRLLSGILASRLHSWKIIGIGQLIMGTAMIILFLPGSYYISALGFFLVGLGNGPLFPNFNYLAPESFGKENSQTVIGVQMSAAYVGIMLAPALCGVVGQHIGMGIFPFYLTVFYIIMMLSTVYVKNVLKRRSNNT